MKTYTHCMQQTYKATPPSPSQSTHNDHTFTSFICFLCTLRCSHKLANYWLCLTVYPPYLTLSHTHNEKIPWLHPPAFSVLWGIPVTCQPLTLLDIILSWSPQVVPYIPIQVLLDQSLQKNTEKRLIYLKHCLDGWQVVHRSNLKKKKKRNSKILAS